MAPAIVIWTTTPWTLPGNRAIAFGADIDYVVAEVALARRAVRRSAGETGRHCRRTGRCGSRPSRRHRLDAVIALSRT